MTNKDKKDDKQLTLTIVNEDRNKRLENFVVDKTTKTGEAAARAAQEMGFPQSNNYRLVLDQTTLDPQRPFSSYPDVKDGTVLHLVDFGGGV